MAVEAFSHRGISRSMRGLWRLRKWRKQIGDCLRLRMAEYRVGHFRPAPPAAHGLGQGLVVSLTSYPPRFPTLAKTIKSLLMQTISPDRLVLWISKEDEDRIPDDVRALEACGLQIALCEDLRSYKKLVPALKEWPESIIVTCDDDVYYEPSWLEGLVATARHLPGAVLSHRAHMARIGSDGRLLPYSRWEMATHAGADRPPDGLLFPTGVGGVLYPPGCFDKRVTYIDLAMRLCPRADDVWFFWMAELAGTPHRSVERPLPDPVPWDGSQEVGLFHDNWLGSGNDDQIRAMESEFGLLSTGSQRHSSE